MKNPLCVALAAAALLAVALPGTVLAQATGTARPAAAAAPAAHRVGLVDMAYIFQNYHKLNDLRDALKAEAEASSGELVAIQQQMQELQKVLTSDTIKKGSPAWNEQEQKAIELNAQARHKQTVLQREFAKKEALMFKQVHDDVTAMVQKYAAHYKYTLVLRYQRDPEGDGDDVNKIAQKVNQLVIYHLPEDDVTERVLAVLNQQYDATKTAAAPR